MKEMRESNWLKIEIVSGGYILSFPSDTEEGYVINTVYDEKDRNELIWEIIEMLGDTGEFYKEEIKDLEVIETTTLEGNRTTIYKKSETSQIISTTTPNKKTLFFELPSNLTNLVLETLTFIQ